MDMSFILEFLSDHFGELLLGLEFLLLNLFVKKLTPEEKAVLKAKKEDRKKARQADLAKKYLAKAEKLVEEEKEEK